MDTDCVRHEEARLDALVQLKLLDTSPSESFDRITRMAAQIFGLPIAAVSLTDRDRQWFKSRVGVSHDSTPRFQAPCSQVADTTDSLIVPDLLKDPVYADCTLARDGIRFYAGAPLVTRNGFGLGALCVLGTEPRAATAQEMSSLNDLAAMVMSQIELQHAYGRVDPISGFPNRIQFLEDLDDLARDANGETCVAVLADLAKHDEISALSRVMGAARLDEMVREAAQALRARLPEGRDAYHTAPTQFVFLAPVGIDLDKYLAVLRDELRDIRAGSSVRFVTTVAVGVMPFRLGEISSADVLRGAHSAAQDARGGDGAINVYSPEADRLHRRRLLLIEEFGKTFERDGELRLVFQPRVAMESGACVGAEALLRWHHPMLGDIGPDEFIPAVERTALVRRATDWVMDAAARQAGRWFRAGLRIPVSFNISAANLDEPDLPQRLQLYLLKHAVPAQFIEVELTESAVMAETPQAKACIQALSDAGVRIAIDDFGTGYSSLAYLQQLPADVVKIDRSFVTDLEHAERDRALITSMIRLSQDLGYRVVAEGIETEAVATFLRDAGCEEAQGYLFGRPMEPGHFERWLRERQDTSIAA